MNPDGVASKGCGRVNDVVLIGTVVVSIGDVKLERFPFTVVAYLERPFLGEFDVLLILHPIDPDVSNFSCFAKWPSTHCFTPS